MPDSILPRTTPQFTTAEYSNDADRCAGCKQPITARYFRANDRTVCEGCAQQLKRRFPKDSHGAYVRGLLLGAGAAILGMILYAAFTIVTGIYLGYVSLAVGWLVGKGMMLGSKGMGGRRYQIAAVILTYAAVSIAAVPIAYSYKMKRDAAHARSAQTKSQQSSSDQTANVDQVPVKPKLSKGDLLLRYLIYGLTSPFLALSNPLHGIIGLIILAIGIRIAWRMTAGSRNVDIRGPYERSAAARGMR
jgi:hypothetical protein